MVVTWQDYGNRPATVLLRVGSKTLTTDQVTPAFLLSHHHHGPQRRPRNASKHRAFHLHTLLCPAHHIPPNAQPEIRADRIQIRILMDAPIPPAHGRIPVIHAQVAGTL